jgi:ubiquinone biosynthesis protein UbiJ
MSKTLAIQLPDELQEQLLQRANKLNMSLESLVLQSLTQLVSSPAPDEFDPISPLLGTLTAKVDDIGENHDRYIGSALQQEIASAE